MPGVDALYYGYDITELDLMPLNEQAGSPSGKRSMLFESSCDEGNKMKYGHPSASERDIPDQVKFYVVMLHVSSYSD